MSVARNYVFALGPLAAAALWSGIVVVSKWRFALVPPSVVGDDIAPWFVAVSLAIGAGVWAVGHKHADGPNRNPHPDGGGLRE